MLTKLLHLLNITCIHFDQPKPIVSLRPASQTDSISLPPLVVVKVLSEGLSLFDIGWSIGENSTNFNPGTNVTLPNRRRELGDVTFTIPFPSNCEKFTLNTKYNGCVESLIGNTCPDVVTPIPHLKSDVIDPTKVAGACQQQSPVPIRSTTRGDLVIVTKESPANTAQNEPPRGVVTNLVLIIEPNVPSPTTKPSEAPIVVQTSQVPPVVVPTSQDLKLQATTTVAIQSSAVVEPPRTASTSVSATSIIVPEVVSIIPPQPSPIIASQPTSATTTSSSIQSGSSISSVEARSTVINILEVPVTTKSAARTLEVCGPLTALLVYLLFDV
ncbi:hypothetical protein BCR33DRAFT_550385 [Rhizoclosmatium globosum]|uniref:Uncharacterized protein n=1 Tax=Rhizoclosmatium globosum TaxID=329046 RepID=A0A1Y2B8S8_9FUNG|nr:hypothetical protein BCR33DRAFT_550385 [Rhizoclosmatium globosum]|eukprot:ORY31154.1 hypothetical protein BCR33DRAFT_550385 [Rhizoclosmatium globosum]